MKWIPALLLLFLFSCGGKTEKVSEQTTEAKSTAGTAIVQVKEEATSKLTFPLYYPVDD